MISRSPGPARLPRRSKPAPPAASRCTCAPAALSYSQGVDDVVSLLMPAVERAGAAQVASWLTPRALVACMLGDTRFAAAALETLRVPESAAALQVAQAFPEV